ncbi:TPA: LPS O-antigen chain length determinant protein WzzB [Citrobacter farmeri]|uniref:LPS O-antigen chain length determinant protein WzzB n=2 Tax=Citrobacter farmeri TaxID=67824 RepID=A0ACA8D8K0_9ENTR|nr:LPS O-antigen chain length determinant protein WzzB [Citrobacter farmeri]HAT2166407.1 LPS O-antigen chain length determinant protein WzzB [Citrobacter freundii]AST80541.1 LPS O-antigen chain length determinant protein WzzB [Citrobacter farmeri]EMB4690594.1 LPS O-antigen chain length determinant protein WzzB [Citrobacter farmeri]MCP1693663.1 chain length determinant protein (polysaccharide antigen chain regulator) [Citrobacter farmeri]MCW2424453.1 chain length determinant protein (polysaccha
MTVENNNMSGRSNEPGQIDLIDIVAQLWRGKVTIIVCAVFTILLAALYLVQATERWTSSAIITQPDAGQIGSYTNAISVLYGKDAPKINDVQSEVIGRFSSAFSALAETLSNQEKPEKLTIDSYVKGQPLPLKIAYQDNSAEAAQRAVAKYIQQVDEVVSKEINADLSMSIATRISDLEQSLEAQEKVAREQKSQRLAQINQALAVAKQANIKLPQVQQADQLSQDTMFMLGSEALSSMVNNEATRPLTFSDDYYQTRQNLLAVKALKIDPESIHAYRYVMKPTLPIRRDSPKRAITLILAALLGGMIGAGVVLGRNALRDYKPKAQ